MSPLPLDRFRVAMAVPILLAGVVSLGWAMGVIWPQWQRLQQAEQQRMQLQEQKERIRLLDQELQALERKAADASRDRERLVALIAGSGDLETLLAMLGEEARRSSVLLDGFEPVAPEPPPAKPAANGKGPPPPPPDPLELEGLQKSSFWLKARGATPRLRDFLRRLETLNLLVIEQDLQLTAADKPGDAPALKMMVSVYAKAAAKPSTAKP